MMDTKIITRWGNATYIIQNEGQEPFDVAIKGRMRWALSCLMRGPVTPITNPAPRWSAYVHDLRGLGIIIETEHVPHSGLFPGTHGRYRLISTVTLGRENEVAA